MIHAMKKIMIGLFATVVLTSVADAASQIASKAYVDAKDQGQTASINAAAGLVISNKADKMPANVKTGEIVMVTANGNFDGSGIKPEEIALKASLGDLVTIQDVDGKEDIANKSENIVLDTGSTEMYTTVKSVEDYAVPRPAADCAGTYCILSVDKLTGDVFWADVIPQ